MAAGLVPRSFAPYQTVADGEIYAVLQALKFTSDHVVIHVDNNEVVQGVQQGCQHTASKEG
eukprot:11456662-Prorocentrum_lima.AAC.1